jgi:hypothetical protein
MGEEALQNMFGDVAHAMGEKVDSVATTSSIANAFACSRGNTRATSAAWPVPLEAAVVRAEHTFGDLRAAYATMPKRARREVAIADLEEAGTAQFIGMACDTVLESSPWSVETDIPTAPSNMPSIFICT